MRNNNIFHTLIDGISFRCEQDPQGRALVFLTEDMQAQEISNEQFYHDIQHYASGFADKGIRPGEIVLLALDHGYELLCCFWGAICCGAIPSILTYWNAGSDVDVYARKVKNLAQAVRARAVISQPGLRSAISTALEKMDCLLFTNLEITAITSGSSSVLPKLEAEQIALMQFTSGTTSEPRAIQFSHRSVLDHIKASANQHHINEDSVYVIWLPFYHDMGLINHIRQLIHAGPLILIPPLTWLKNPAILYKAISQYRGTASSMPNFAFDYSVQRIREEDLKGIDLSSWQMLSNGSEPVALSSVQRFRDRFSSYGFHAESLIISYGMAENLAGVSCTPYGQLFHVDWVSMDDLQKQKRAIPVDKDSFGARAVVSCGYPYQGIDLAIIDEHWARLADRELGEIVIKSNTLFSGYYLHPEHTEGLFCDGWFRTGDIGYMVDGQLYVCGRKKDLIIVGGRNIHPQVIENIAADVFGPFAGRCAVFGVSDLNLGTELPILIIEQRKQIEAAEKKILINKVRRQVSDELDIAISDIQLVPKGWVVKTTSGKIARAANREKYIQEMKSDADEQDTISPDQLTPEQAKDNLINLFEKILGITGIGKKDNFFILGGDSLSALRLLFEIERQFCREVSAAEFFQKPTVEHLVEILCKESANKTTVNDDTPSCRRMENIFSQRKRPRFSELLSDCGKRIIIRIKQLPRRVTPSWLYDQRWFHYLLNLKNFQSMRQFYRLLKSPGQSHKAFFSYALKGNIPQFIKKKLYRKPWFYWLNNWSIEADMSTLREACKNGNGVIAVYWHAHVWASRLIGNEVRQMINPNAYSFIGRARIFLPPPPIELFSAEEKEMKKAMIFLEQLLKAKKTLLDGGIVSMLPDGRQGASKGLELSFHGCRRSFRAGFAELAVETGALVIPISIAMDLQSRQLKISSLKPLDAGIEKMPRKQRVESLVKQYAAFLEQEWARSPALVPYIRMKQHIDLPPS